MANRLTGLHLGTLSAQAVSGWSFQLYEKWKSDCVVHGDVGQHTFRPDIDPKAQDDKNHDY